MIGDYKKYMDIYGQQVKLSNGIIGTLITYHDNGSLQVRINRGQQWAWQIISVSEDDAEFINAPIEDPEDEEEKEDLINNQNPSMSNKAIIITIIGIAILFLWVGYMNTIKRWSSELETTMSQINQMNIDDIQDIGSCKALKKRKIEKAKLLEKIKAME